MSGTVTLNGTAKSGVSVSLSGSSYVTTNPITTDESGNFTFENIAKDETVKISIAATDEYKSYTSDNIEMTENKNLGDISLVAKTTATDISEDFVLSANDLNVGTYENGDVLGGKLTVTASGKTASVDEPTVSTTFGGATYTRRFMTGGADRDLVFKTTKPAYVQVVMQATGSSDTRTLYIKKGDTTINSKVAEYTKVNTLNATLTEAGTYTIHPDKNISIYSIAVIMDAGLVDASTAANGKVYYNATNAYAIAAVSEAEKEANDTIAIKMNEVTSTPKTTVYKTVKIGNIIITADDLSSDYIYAVKGNNAISNGKLDIAKAFEKVLG